MDSYRELPEVLAEINIPFKISAGPGAGKTTWLVNHVQNVIKSSDKLNRTQKVACITYTRIGAVTVDKKVNEQTGTNRLDIGTVHSFLYRNVIKPFSYLIEKDEMGIDFFNINELSGHIEHRPSYDRIASWINKIGYKFSYLMDQKKKDSAGLTNLEKTGLVLSNFEWKFSEGSIDYGLRYNRYRNLKFPSTKLKEYKYSCWSKGIMHHEDVLFFTHYIFNKNPRVVELLSNKFQYLFIDEFQDTTPLQTWIIKKISEKGTVVGVIGDPAQSIFKFAGAQRRDFNDFTLPDITNYKKLQNYRSTCKIIDFLECLRDDIKQIPKDDTIMGDDVTFLIGDDGQALEFVQNLDDDYSVLCRYNKDVNRLRNKFKSNNTNNLINQLYSSDSNYIRPKFIHSLLKAYDFHENGEYKNSIRELNKILIKLPIDDLSRRRLAINIIEYLKQNKEKSIHVIYDYWQKKLIKEYSIKLTGLKKPKPVHNIDFIDFLPFLSKETKIESKIRTIHQSKGAEFNDVLICLYDKTDKNGKVSQSIDTIITEYIINSKKNIILDSDKGEETRLFYVACSRAKKKLFLNVSKVTEKNQSILKTFGVVFKKL